ncbi:unnamed protein product, partial [Larinioides sclopetarius]
PTHFAYYQRGGKHWQLSTFLPVFEQQTKCNFLRRKRFKGSHRITRNYGGAVQRLFYLHRRYKMLPKQPGFSKSYHHNNYQAGIL